MQKSTFTKTDFLNFNFLLTGKESQTCGQQTSRELIGFKNIEPIF